VRPVLQIVTYADPSPALPAEPRRGRPETRVSAAGVNHLSTHGCTLRGRGWGRPERGGRGGCV